MSGLSNYPPGVTGNEPQIAGEVCPCGDDCEQVAVDCCDDLAWECETSKGGGGDELVRTHRLGTGCAIDPLYDSGDMAEQDADLAFEEWVEMEARDQ